MANIMTYDSAYLAKLSEFVKDDVAYARYKVEDEWTQTSIISASILTDGRIEIIFEIDFTEIGDKVVDSIELYDQDDTRICSRDVNLTSQEAAEGLLYRCRLSIFQVTPSPDNTGAYDSL